MKKVLLVALVIVLVAFLYRGYDLDADSFWIDESYTVLAAKNIGSYGTPGFDSGSSYNRAWPQSYMLFGLGSLFGFGHASMRILSVLAGVAVVWLVFVFCRRFYSSRVGLIAAGLFALSQWQILWSRQARMYIFLELMFFLSAYLYLLWFEKKSVKLLSLTVLSVYVTYVFHPVGLVLIPVFGIHYVLSTPWSQLKTLKKNIPLLMKKNRVGSILILLILTALLLRVASVALSVSSELEYFRFYKNFFLEEQYLFLFLGVIGLFGRKEWFGKSAVFALSALGMLVMFSSFVELLNFRYLFLLGGILLVFSALGVEYLLSLYKNKWYKIGLSVFLLILLVVSGFFGLPKGHYDLEAGTPQPPFEEAYAFVEGLIEEDDVLIVSQPAIAELYLRKPDYWLAFSYEGKENASAYNRTSLIERYTGTQTLDTQESLLELLNSHEGFIIVDDMAMERYSYETRLVVTNQTFLKSFGNRYWSRVFVYSIG